MQSFHNSAEWETEQIGFAGFAAMSNWPKHRRFALVERRKEGSQPLPSWTCIQFTFGRESVQTALAPRLPLGALEQSTSLELQIAGFLARLSPLPVTRPVQPSKTF
jgi:hypothetical protein